MTTTLVPTYSGSYDPESKTLYIGKKPFGVRTYENLLEDLEIEEWDIQTIDMTEISIGQKAKELIVRVHELGIPLNLSLAHEQELISMLNSGSKQIDEMGSEYIDWLISKSLELNNPFMVLEEDGKPPALVQYLGSKGDIIRLKKIRPYATQPKVCDEELKLGRDIYSIININKSDILTKQIVWRFVGTGLEYSIAETLNLVITGQLTFQG